MNPSCGIPVLNPSSEPQLWDPPSAPGQHRAGASPEPAPPLAHAAHTILGHCTTSHTRPPPAQGWTGLTSSQSRAGTHRRLGTGFPPPRSPGGSCKSCFLAPRHLLGQKSLSANPQQLGIVVTQVKRTLKRLSFALCLWRPFQTSPSLHTAGKHHQAVEQLARNKINWREINLTSPKSHK